MSLGSSDAERRGRLTKDDLRRANETVRVAWDQLPVVHREFLEEIGASQWQVVNEPIGVAVNRFKESAGQGGLDSAARVGLEDAVAVWMPDIRIVLIDVGSSVLDGLDALVVDRMIARLAWHEWGHALSFDRCLPEDVVDGKRLLEMAPEGVRENIRRARYRPKEYTHEVVAEIYAMLIGRRRRNELGRPKWLDDEIYELVMRATGWTE